MPPTSRHNHGPSEARHRPEVQASLSKLKRALAANLRAHRTAVGLTQEEAAERAGLHPKHIQRLEGGKTNATLATLAAMAILYGTSVDALLKTPSDTRA